MASNESATKETIRRVYEECLNQGRLELFDELATPDHVEHDPFPQQSQGVEGLKQRAAMIRAAFNPTFTLEHVIVEGDKVAVMWTNHGTHVGEWFGFAPTGKSVTARGVDVYGTRDGRIAEHWDIVDVSDFYVAVGLLPPRPAAASR
jgi:predicted ester cyclase